jgi:ABC-2 type transport system permease protein|tara:strand:+ start:4258 stop:5109 length:852 start_codon:yes stop_codon:yes gene_type:complete
MSRFSFFQFFALLKKEFWENRILMIGTPAVLAIVIFVVNFLLASQLSEEQLSSVIGYFNRWFDGENPFYTAPIITLLCLPFVVTYFFCSVIYLLNALYSDRKDMSILFWQSMPISNLQTVMSKIVTVVIVSPIFTVAAIAVLYGLTIGYLTVIGYGLSAQLSGLFYMFVAVAVNLSMVYFFLATSVFWLFPLVGWLLLFSAFARRAPILLAIGVYFLLGFLEGFIFNTRFLSNWAQTRFDPDNFIIVDYSGILDRLFSYDMFIGLVVGALLISGSVYMRRYAE